MKVFINALSARLGGGQTYIKNLLERLPQRSDIEYVVYCPSDLKIPSCKNLNKLGIGIWGDNPLLRTFWEMFIFPFILRKESADILFCPGGILNTKVPKRCKTVTMFRNMIPFDERVRKSIPSVLQKIRNWLLYRSMLKSMAVADLTIFISDYARSVIESLVTVKKAVTIPHGINDLFRQSDLPMPTTVPDAEYLLYVSRFDVYKHHYEVIEGYLMLPEYLRSNYKLVIIGETGTDEFERCSRLVRQHNAIDDIVILGAIEYQRLPAFYQHAYLNLFASSCENCPNILLEALASGRPVLSSNVMPMPEFGGDNVVYFSPFESRSIKDSLVGVLGNETIVSELSKKAKEQSLKYSWEACAKDTWGEIFQLCKVGCG